MSIVVPTATIDRLLVLAIDSIVKQEGVDLECLIVLGKDAECSDTAFSYDEPQVRIIRSNAESPGEAIQSGLDKATGEFIGILSSDDIYQPGALRTVVEHFD